MKCAACVEQGTKSRLFDEGSSRTSMGFSSYHDEDGWPHYHDPNTTKTTYKCSNDHRTVLVRRSQCNTAHCVWNEKHSKPSIFVIEDGRHREVMDDYVFSCVIAPPGAVVLRGAT